MLNAWQAQQRVQKEEERKAKTEATAAHQNYRRSGLSEEETKLAALREEERLQKQNAEQQLRGYRGQLSEEEAKLAAQKQEEIRKKQALEEQLRHNGVVSSHDPTARHMSLTELNSGVVSALAAGYSSPSPQKQQLPMPSSSTFKEIPSQPDFSTAIIPDATAADTVAAISAAISESIVVDDNHAAAEEPNVAAVPDATPDVPATPTPTSTPGEGLLDTTVASEVVPISAASIEIETETETPPSPIVLAPPSPPSPPPAPAPAPISTIINSSVMFMFGILTASDVDASSPEDRSRLVEGYLARADQIVRSVIADNSTNHPSFQSILSSLVYPVASSVEKDPCKYYTAV